MRLDKALWFLRFAASRTLARQWVEAGHIRINGRRIEKPGSTVRPGDVLTLPLRSQVKVIELIAIPARRGPAGEAQSCYRVLDAHGEMPIAARNSNTPEGTCLP